MEEKKAEKNNCTVIESKDFFVNCQQHKYFVLLFVPFCKKKKMLGKKKKKKKGKESVVSSVCL